MTDDGRPPLAASGLKLHGRLTKVVASLDRVAAKAGFSALVGFSIHSLFDGVAIAAGLLVTPQLGVLLFLAVFLTSCRRVSPSRAS